MSTLRSPWTLVMALAAAALGWLAALAAPSLGMPAPVVGRTGLLTAAAVCVLCLVLGRRVRRDRERPLAERMDPIAAARTLVLGQAAGFTGAALAGWHAAAAAQVASRAGVDAPTAADAVLIAVGGLAMLGVGLLVEHWCRIPPEDDGAAGPGGSSGAETTHGGGRRGRPEIEGGYAYGRG